MKNTAKDTQGNEQGPESPTSERPTSERPSAGTKFWRSVREIAIIVVIALAVSTALKAWVVRSFYIPSASMEDTLQVNDRIMVNQLPFVKPQRGSIVVFNDPGGWLPPDLVAEYKPNPFFEFVGLAPSDAGQQLIKRVIAVGGDHVECCDAQGRVSVNGQAIDEPYIKPGTAPSEVEFSVDVPADHYWVMGDNRGNSADSRFHLDAPGGPFVSKDDLVGTVFVISWPSNRFRWVGAPDTFDQVPAGQ